METARLLIDTPLPGPANMARDEALLCACPADAAPPILRLYTWSPPTISLGYFQDHAEYQRLPPPAGDLPVVRRTTGGGAILHDLELTYSITIPIAHPLIHGHPNRLYALAHLAVIDAVAHGTRLLGDKTDSCGDPPTLDPQSAIPTPQSSQRGPFFCFERRHDLDVVIDDPHGPGGVSKIAGSAQRRTQHAILQHGSIILDTRYTQQPVATWSALADAPTTFDQAAERLLSAFEEQFRLAFTPDSWRDDELDAAAHFERRYAGQPWTLHRRR